MCYLKVKLTMMTISFQLQHHNHNLFNDQGRDKTVSLNQIKDFVREQE